MADDLRALVLDVLAGIAPDAADAPLDPARSLRAQLDLDSLDFLAYVERLSEATGHPIPEDDYPAVDTLDGAVALLSVPRAG